MRHHAGDLMEVRQIVRGPRREQLPQRDQPKHRMRSTPLEVRWLQVQRAQLVEVPRPDQRKLIEQLTQRFVLALAFLCLTIESLERSRLTEVEDHLRPRHPVASFAVN